MISEREMLRIVQDYERDINNVSFYVGRAIPEKKEINAVDAYGDRKIRRGCVLALYDGTIFGSAKEGIMFTDCGIYYHYVFDKWAVMYDDIERIEIGRGDNGSDSDILYLITRKREYKVEISTLNKNVLRSMIEELCGMGRGHGGRYDDRYDSRYDRYDDRYDRRDDRYDDRYNDRYDDRYDRRRDRR